MTSPGVGLLTYLRSTYCQTNLQLLLMLSLTKRRFVGVTDGYWLTSTHPSRLRTVFLSNSTLTATEDWFGSKLTEGTLVTQPPEKSFSLSSCFCAVIAYPILQEYFYSGATVHSRLSL